MIETRSELTKNLSILADVFMLSQNFNTQHWAFTIYLYTPKPFKPCSDTSETALNKFNLINSHRACVHTYMNIFFLIFIKPSFQIKKQRKTFNFDYLIQSLAKKIAVHDYKNATSSSTNSNRTALINFSAIHFKLSSKPYSFRNFCNIKTYNILKEQKEWEMKKMYYDIKPQESFI